MHKSIHTPAYRKLVRLLAEARKKAGVTQAALARKLGRPQSFVAKLEGCERRLDVIEFLVIARHLQADPCALLRRVASARPKARAT